MSKRSIWQFIVTSVSLLLLGLAAQSTFADGTETLAPPDIAIASGSGIVAAGTGMVTQPGSITIDVPAGATVNQVLLYWEGQMSTNVAGDDTIVINNNIVTGTLIGGPTFFFSNTYSSAFRADITGLGLVSAGANTLAVDDLSFSKVANGAGVLVVFDDGSGIAEINIRDGLDNAFINFPEPRQGTVPQTITFAPAGVNRVADFDLFFSSVAGTISGADADRPTSIEVTVDGTTTVFSNELASLDGEEWDTVNIGFDIPAGASSLTVQAFSRDDNNTNNLPASFTWTAAGLSILPPATLGDRVWEDLNADGVQNCEDSNSNGILGDAGDTGLECDTGIPGVTVNLLSPGPDAACNTGDESFIRDTITGTNGFYGFDDLVSGDYCVEFVKETVVNLCDAELGDPMFTGQDIGNDTADSDADPTSGATGVISLVASETNLTVDAGVYCPAKLGDRVWEDFNRDGNQNNGEPGINGVTAELFVCGENGEPDNTPIAMTTTNTMNAQDGIYMFDGLMPGNYAVRFSSLPSGFVFSPANQGSDDTVDSDANTASGFTMCAPLESNQTDLDRDAGLNQPPAGLGNRVWEDKDADGVQEAGEGGISGVTVNLLTTGPDGQCDTGDETLAATTTTTGDGMYEFLGLDPVRHCVEFDINSVDICTLGTAKFTAQNQGADDTDSDVNATTSQTGNIDLAPNAFDPTNDAGVYCPAKLGDRAWKDTDKDGIQDDGENGINDVTAELFICDANGNPVNGPIDTTTTSNMNGEDGIYMFTDLTPGNYAVRFVKPVGLVFSPANQGSDDSVDSDASPASGLTDCMPLGSNENNTTKDAGFTEPAECGIGVQKMCEVIAPPAPGLQECDGKLQQFSLIWGGSGPITVSGPNNDAPGGVVNSGDEVTFSGPFLNNDVFVTIAGAVNGESKFHVSCSDGDMNGETDDPTFPQDCGKAEGDGKDNDSGFINTWLLEGLVDKSGDTLNCTAEPQLPTANCEFHAEVASCNSLPNKPDNLTFSFTGGSCGASSNAQGDKFDCSGSIDPTQPISGTTNNGDVFTVDPGGIFTIPRTGSETEIMLSNSGGTEFLNIHTSCSRPLETGNVFGSLTLTALNGIGSGREVRYSYALENLGTDVITDIVVDDDRLGLIGSGFSLNPGESTILTATTIIDSTTTNTATVTGTSAPGAVCAASSEATVTVLPPPPCSVSGNFKKLKDNAIKYTLTNTSNRLATVETFVLNFPNAYGNIKEVKLDGAIYKSGDSPLVVGSGDVISDSDWTTSDVSKRQLAPGEKRTFEIKFTKKSKDFGSSDFGGTVTFKEGCLIPL